MLKKIRIFAKNRIDMLEVKSFAFNGYSTNTYLIKNEKHHCVAVDPAFCSDGESKFFWETLGDSPLDAVLITHNHFDHIYGVADILEKSPQTVVYMSDKDREMCGINPILCNISSMPVPQEFVWKNAPETIPWGERNIKVIATPGHTKGSVAYYFGEDSLLFSGDTLFAGAIGRSDLPGGDYDELMRSLWFIMDNIPSETDVFPGHGPVTSIGREATVNPFLVPIDAE